MILRWRLGKTSNYQSNEMTLSLCKHECWQDRDTGEIFCPGHGWVLECPKLDHDDGYDLHDHTVHAGDYLGDDE